MISKRRIGISLKLAVSAALIAIVCRNIDRDGIAAGFSGQSSQWLFAAALLSLGQILVAALRWRQILVGLGVRVPAETVAEVTFVGSFFNSWLLGVVGGDVARAMLVPAEARGRSVIVQSVLFDRVATLAGLGLVIIPIVALNIGPLARGVPLLVSLGASMLPFAGLFCVAPAVRIGGRFGLPFLGYVDAIGEGWHLLCAAWRRLLAALAISASGMVAISLTAYCLARAQHLDVSVLDFLVLMPPVVLLSALPVSVGGWGVRENAMVVGLGSVGIAAGPAVVVSVQMGLLAALVSLPGGALWLIRYLGRHRLAPVASP